MPNGNPPPSTTLVPARPTPGKPPSDKTRGDKAAPDTPAPAPLTAHVMSHKESAELSSLGQAVGELVQLGLTLPDIAARRGMPPLDSLLRWMAKGDLRRVYDRAVSLRAEVMADAVVAIADRAAGDSLAGAKLRMDARKWRVGLFRKDAEFGPLHADHACALADAERELREWARRVQEARAQQSEQDRQRMLREAGERAARERAEQLQAHERHGAERER